MKYWKIHNLKNFLQKMTQIVNPFEEILPKKESLPYIILYHITDEIIVQSRIRFDPGNMEISL
jgi:hypothetical protein